MRQANPRVAEAHFQNSRERVRQQTCMHAKGFAAQSRGCSAGPSRPFKGLETLHCSARRVLTFCLQLHVLPDHSSLISIA